MRKFIKSTKKMPGIWYVLALAVSKIKGFLNYIIIVAFVQIYFSLENKTILSYS